MPSEHFEPINLSEEQAAVRETARKFAREKLAPIAAKIDVDGKIPRELYTELGNLSLLGVPIPEAYGGMGLDLLCAATAVEELASACASTALSVSAHVGLCASPIAKFGSDVQKKRLLPDLCSGKKLGAFGLTEPSSGSDAASLRTTAAKKGKTYVLNGAKLFITNALVADVFFVAVKTNPDAGAKGITALIVERGMKGFQIVPGPKKLGMRGSDWGELVFHDCEVPEENRVGDEGGGFKLFMDTLVGGRVGIAALGVGLARAAFETAAQYASERRQFGKPIGSFQALGEMLANMSVGYDAARLLTYRAAQLRSSGTNHLRACSAAKLYSSEVCNRICNDAVQILGGYGYTQEFPAERFFRDAKLLEIGEGTSQVQRLILAREILGKLD